MRHDVLPATLDEDDIPPRCTCTYTAGDAYYCQLHGGNGSWISLLRQLVEEAKAKSPSDQTRSALREASARLPEGHPLRERAEQAVGPLGPAAPTTEPADPTSAAAADSLLARTRALHREARAMKGEAWAAVSGLARTRPDYLLDRLEQVWVSLEILAEDCEKIRALHEE